MNTSKPILISRVFRREEAGASAPASVPRVSKSEIRSLFSDVFEEKGLSLHRRATNVTDEAA